MGSKMTQIQALFSSTVLELRKELKVSASRTKSQQVRAFKFLFYTVSQIVFLFTLLTHCKRPNSYVSRCCCFAISLVDCQWDAAVVVIRRRLFIPVTAMLDAYTSTIKQFHLFWALVPALRVSRHRHASKADYARWTQVLSQLPSLPRTDLWCTGTVVGLYSGFTDG